MSTPHHAPDLRALAESGGLRRIHLLAWRDLDDVEAGGSEVHAATVARLWAEAGIDVTMRTSTAANHPPEIVRDGYRVIRRSGRYMVFPSAAIDEMAGRHGERDALVEIWNGMPFFTPLWAKGPRCAWLHHVHAEMWQMMLREPWATIGARLEDRIAPKLYRRTPIVTLAESSRRELVEELGFKAARVSVVPPGIDPSFSPGGTKARHPLVVAVGRVTPVKRFHLLVDAVAPLKATHPELRVEIVGEGFERVALQERIDAAGGHDWIILRGFVTNDEIVDLYRRAWVLASTSAREGWGMTITEAAACGTPAVVSRIGGHRDAVVDGETGMLVETSDMTPALDRILKDAELRERLSAAARRRAEAFTWEATAAGTLQVLVDAARQKR